MSSRPTGWDGSSFLVGGVGVASSAGVAAEVSVGCAAAVGADVFEAMDGCFDIGACVVLCTCDVKRNTSLSPTGGRSEAGSGTAWYCGRSSGVTDAVLPVFRSHPALSDGKADSNEAADGSDVLFAPFTVTVDEAAAGVLPRRRAVAGETVEGAGDVCVFGGGCSVSSVESSMLVANGELDEWSEDSEEARDDRTAALLFFG